MRLEFDRSVRRTMSVIVMLGLAAATYGADDAATATSSQNTATQSSDAQQVQALTQELTEQQKQIEELRQLLLNQKKQIDGVAAAPPAGQAVETPAKTNVGDVATIAPIMPPLPAAPA